MAQLRLDLPRAIERRFREVAKRLFPLEAYGLLLGTVAGETVYVEDIFIPEDLAEYSKPDRVEVRPEWLVDAAEQAKDDGQIVAGELHSHTYRKRETVFDAVQSERDIQGQGGFFVYGVCNVVESKRGLRAYIRFWGPSIQVVRI